MAYIDKDDEHWLTWKIELLRRGLWPTEGIEIHGPHEAPSDIMWGRTNCKSMDGNYHDVQFQSRRPCRAIWDIHGVTVWEEEGRYRGVTFPLLKAKELTPRWRKLLSIAQKKRAEL